MAGNYGRAFIGPDGFLEMRYCGNISEQILKAVLVESDRRMVNGDASLRISWYVLNVFNRTQLEVPCRAKPPG